MKKLLQLIALILIVPFNSQADCLACSELKGVTIILNSGEKIEGYIRWNPIWVYYNNENHPVDTFPTNVISYHRRVNFKLFAFKKIIFFNDLFPDVPFVLKNDIDSVDANEIKEILSMPGIYDSTASTALQEISTEKFKLLQQKPIAKFCGSLEVVSDVCFVSYNKEYTENKLQEIVKENYWAMIEDLEKKKVLIFEFAYD